MLCEAAGLVALVLVLAFALSARNSISLQRPSLRLPLPIPAIEAAMLLLALEACRGPSHLWHVFHCYRGALEGWRSLEVERYCTRHGSIECLSHMLASLRPPLDTSCFLCPPLAAFADLGVALGL